MPFHLVKFLRIYIHFRHKARIGRYSLSYFTKIILYWSHNSDISSKLVRFIVTCRLTIISLHHRASIFDTCNRLTALFHIIELIAHILTQFLRYRSHFISIGHFFHLPCRAIIFAPIIKDYYWSEMTFLTFDHPPHQLFIDSPRPISFTISLIQNSRLHVSHSLLIMLIFYYYRSEDHWRHISLLPYRSYQMFGYI